jgi:hypothetical protein
MSPPTADSQPELHPLECTLPMESLLSELSRALVQGRRSTVLQPLLWLLGTSVIALLTAIRLGSPDWIAILLAVFSAIAFALACLGFVWFAVKDPDALRSERFTIEKMRLQKQILGDSMTGFVEVDVDLASTGRLTAPAPKRQAELKE